MRLYNLCDAHHALNNVALRRIKISRIEDLNDPFELLGVDVRDKRLRASFRAAKRDMHEDGGVICFSKTWQNPVMWSHYGDKHRGICLGFDVSDSELTPVSYEPDLLKVDDVSQLSDNELTEQLFSRLVSTKFRDWGYEEEMRAYITLDHSTSEGGLYFFEFSKNIQLREIILGARCVIPIDKVKELASSFNEKVHVKKARIAFTKFSVVEDRSFRDSAA